MVKQAPLLVQKIFSKLLYCFYFLVLILLILHPGNSLAAPLHQNVILNEDKISKLTHIEITKDHIRIEFDDVCPEYKAFASLGHLSPSEQKVRLINQ